MTRTQFLNAKPLPCFVEELRDRIRAGRKTETRRVITPQPPSFATRSDFSATGWGPDRKHQWLFTDAAAFESWSTNYRYRRGDICYLREPLYNVNGWAHYADDQKPTFLKTTPHPPAKEARCAMPWRRTNWEKLKRNSLPQIHMPRFAARTFVRIVQVRAERLQSIREKACLAEGIHTISGGANVLVKGRKIDRPVFDAPLPAGVDQSLHLTAKRAFQSLWDSINAGRDDGQYAWANNPWVWVIKFKLIE